MVQTLVIPNALKAEPQLIDFGADLVPPLGGVAQRVSRVGSRWLVNFSGFQQLSPHDARRLLAKLMKARTLGETVLAAWPQPDFDLSIGTPLVKGAGQTGSTLTIDGLPHSTSIALAGYFFSMTVSSRNYLYQVADDITTNSSGEAILNISPLLRASPADNAALEFTTPKIEGFADGMEQPWTIEMLKYATVPLTIREVE